MKLNITVLMPQSGEPCHWFGAVAGREGSWPMELPNPRPLLRPPCLRTFSRIRHRTLSTHLWGQPAPDWTAGSAWLYLRNPIQETAEAIRRKFEERDNRNLVDIFVRKDARKALLPQWHQAQAELDAAKGTCCPQFDMNIPSVLAALSQRDAERVSYRTQVSEAHVNLAVWRDQYGRLWRRKQ